MLLWFQYLVMKSIGEAGQFGGKRSLIMKRRMRQATTIIVLNFILIDIPCYFDKSSIRQIQLLRHFQLRDRGSFVPVFNVNVHES